LLNHSTGEYTCDRCRAHFKRKDLLGKGAISLPYAVDAGLYMTTSPTLSYLARASTFQVSIMLSGVAVITTTLSSQLFHSRVENIHGQQKLR
jgi:hypothetical protein